MCSLFANGRLLDVCSHFRRVSKDLSQALLESINVVVDQMLPMDFTLVNQAHECKAFVNFPQVQNNVLLIVCMGKPYNWWWLFVEFRSVLLVIPINASHVNKYINELWAYFVVLHVHRCRICRYVHFWNNIEQEGLLDLWPVNESIHHLRDESDLRQ